MFRTPCETTLWKLLPSLRKELVIYLVKDKKIPRRKAAKIIGVTEPAISQYLKNKRGSVKFTNKQKKEIRKTGDNLIKNSSKKTFVKCMCRLCSCMEVGCR